MKGKVVLVTGANGGLGTYVTQAFLHAGATVAGTSRKYSSLISTTQTSRRYQQSWGFCHLALRLL
jgi:NAD(P)-dependent dehydrogenase (short-subunit alcohol dehydrogenase family)